MVTNMILDKRKYVYGPKYWHRYSHKLPFHVCLHIQNKPEKAPFKNRTNQKKKKKNIFSTSLT